MTSPTMTKISTSLSWNLCAGAALVFVGACGGGESKAGPDEYFLACEDVVDKPFAGDESFRAIANAESAMKVVVDDIRAPVLLEPRLAPSGAPTRIGTSKPVTFVLRSMSVLPGARRHDARTKPRSDMACGRARRETSLWETVASAFVLERRAYAHCPAFTGENYLLRLSKPAAKAGEPDEVIYSALLSETTFTPNAPIWLEKVRPHAGSQVKLTLVRAVFTQGRITEGPFVGSKPILFELTAE